MESTPQLDRQPQHSRHMGADAIRSGDRRPYASPSLVPYGDVRDLTMGASPGNTDTGGLGKEIGL